jgi:hypothetical protein
MSQSVPLSKLLPRYNTAVESFQQRMQQDNVEHLDNMLSLYAYGIQGGSSSSSMGYLEKKLAARDDYNIYRTDKDATEWMTVDKKLHSYLGRDMNILTGGDKDDFVPATKEPQLVQSLKLLSAYLKSLAEKMMSARHTSFGELMDTMNEMMNDPETPPTIKGYVRALKDQAESDYEQKLDRDAEDMLMIEEYTVKALAPNTSRTILRTGIVRRLPERSAQQLLEPSHARHVLQHSHVAQPSSFSNLVKDMSVDSESEDVDPEETGLEGGSTFAAAKPNSGPKFRSSAAQHLYNVISQ